MVMDNYYTIVPGNSSSASSTSTTSTTTHNVMMNQNNKEKKNKAGTKKCTGGASSSSSGGGGGGCSKGFMKLSTDPQSVAARERRHRISERFKILQSLVPGGTKMDTASMLEEAIHYVKFLKTQIRFHQTIIMMNHFNINVDQPHHQDPPSDHVDHDLLLLAASSIGTTTSPNNNNIISSLVPHDHHLQHGDIDDQYSLYKPSNLLHDHGYDQVLVVPPAQPINESTAFVEPCMPFGFDQDVDDETTMWLIHDLDDHHQYSANYY